MDNFPTIIVVFQTTDSLHPAERGKNVAPTFGGLPADY
jgi:hypothetical protein